jgi:hypothetical protein
MSTMQGRSDTATTPEEYIAGLEGPRRAQVRRVHDLIRRAAPKLTPHIDRGMIGYGTVPNVLASGREDVMPVIALASNKRSISLYFNTRTPKGVYIAESYKGRVPGANVSKYCVRFTRLDRVDETVLQEMVKAASRSRG